MTYLFVISAPSGAGKTTLCQRLLRDFPDQLVLSISSTTRAPRPGEKAGREYHFLTAEEFQKQISAQRFAEWALVHGNYYGTSKDVVDQAFSASKSVLLDIDVQGADSLKKAYPEACVRVFITPPSIAELEKRLRDRKTDSDETIRKRLKNAESEMKKIPEFDHVVVNDQFDRAYGELHALLAHHLGSKKPQKGNRG